MSFTLQEDVGRLCISYLDIQIVKLILNRVELMRLLSYYTWRLHDGNVESF